MCLQLIDVLAYLGGGLGAVLGLLAVVWKATDIIKFFRGYTLKATKKSPGPTCTCETPNCTHNSASGGFMFWALALICVALLGVAVTALVSA